MDGVIQRLKEYKDKSKGVLTRAVTNSNNRKEKKPENKKGEYKQLYGYIKRQRKDITHDMTWT